MAGDYQGGVSNDLMASYVAQQVREIGPRRVVDFGAGLGKMGRLCRELLGDEAALVAVEGFERTAETLRAMNLYNRVDHALIQDWLRANTERFDLAIFGDVLEHLTRKQAFEALNRALAVAANVIINIPLRNLHQDCDDNPLELHRGYFTDRCFDARYVLREKHVASPSAGYAKMNMWIVARRQFRLKTAIKGRLLRHFGRPAKVALEKFGYDTYVNA